MTHAPDPHARASDADRSAAVDELKASFAEGRLTLDEYDERVREAHSAVTYADLRNALRQLPATLPHNTPSTGGVRTQALQSALAERLTEPLGAQHHGPTERQRWAVFGVLSLMLIAIWLVTDAGGYFWPIWPIMAFVLAAALRAARNLR